MIFVLSFILNVSQAQAACSTVDLRAQMGPIRNQGDKGWCYANAAADLISYKLRKELNGQQISAGYTALAFLRYYGINSTGEGGLISPAILAVSRYGFCPRSVEDDLLSHGLTNKTLSERIEDLKNFKRDWDKRKNPQALKRFNDKYDEYVRTGSLVGKIPRPQLEKILTGTSLHAFMSTLAKSICADQVKYPSSPLKVKFDTRLRLVVGPYNFDHSYFMDIPEIELDPFNRVDGFFNVIDKQLEKKNVVGIDYYSDFLTKPFMNSSAKYSKKGGHASVIVGRRLNTESQKCEYLVRNSWGSDCWSYAERSQCEGGNIWIPKDVLRDNLESYVYIP